MEYENLFKKFLILNCSKRNILEKIMRDSGMNVGHKNEERKLYMESLPEQSVRPSWWCPWVYTEENIQQLLISQKFKELIAIYLLPG